MEEAKISVIIPVHNRKNLLFKCLNSIKQQDYINFEVIIVDDCSNIDLKPVIKIFNAKHFYLKKNKGPAYARNFGSIKSSGEILMFIDSDVLLSSNNIFKKVNFLFNKNKSVSAIQGNYTSDPYYGNFTSFFKNITLHFYFRNQTNKNKIYSLATFCTAIRKIVFISSGGFDSKIKKASVEDDEFGVKLTRQGYKIIYRNDLQVKHMKKFNFYTLMKQDFKTGSAKIKSLLRKNNLIDPRELQGSHASSSLLFSIPLSGIIFLNILLLTYSQSDILRLSLLCLFGIFILLNLNYFYFIYKSKGTISTIGSLFLSIVDYLSISLGIITGILDYFLLGNKY